MQIRDVLIVGGGPAGITFANQYKRIKPEADVVMFRPEAHSMVYCAIPYAIEGLFDPTRVFKRDEFVTDAGVEVEASNEMRRQNAARGSKLFRYAPWQ
ncbi:MAG: NAD(P)/FAD-dependent oxidoreductase [Chitinispirillaceae bacterium]|nr:NAD(P)/FAD-dependent oxidoreductase [Chitinispirillaceae bacterium]